MRTDKLAYRVLFHLDESASCRVEDLLRSVGHLLDELSAEGLEVEVVAHADGLAALQKAANPQADTIGRLAARGVRFAACRNTMRRLGVTPDDLLQVVQTVPSGVGELVRRQGKGWLYVRI